VSHVAHRGSNVETGDGRMPYGCNQPHPPPQVGGEVTLCSRRRLRGDTEMQYRRFRRLYAAFPTDHRDRRRIERARLTRSTVATAPAGFTRRGRDE